MYLDAELLFSHAQKITASQASDKILDLGVMEGAGMPILPFVHVVESFAGLTSLTVHIQSANADKAMDELAESDWQTILSSQKLLPADIAKPCSLAFGSLPPKAGRYLRVKYEAEAEAAETVKGAITAGLVLDRQA